MLFLPTIILVLIQILLSVLLFRVYVLATNRKQVLFLLLITVSLTTWTAVNTALLHDPTTPGQVSFSNIINSLGYFLGAISVVQIYNFSFYFPQQVLKITAKNKLFLAGSLLLCCSAFISSVTGKFTYTPAAPENSYAAGSAYIIFIIFILIYVVLFLRRSYLSAKQFPASKNQLRTMSIGLALTAVHGLLFIVLLPLVFGEKNLIYSIGYAAPIYFVAATVYSLLSQQLFDVRNFVIKSAVYVGTLTTVAGLFSAIVLGIIGKLSGVHYSAGEAYTIFAVATSSAILFDLFKDPVTRQSRRLFLTSFYNPQSLFNSVSNATMSSGTRRIMAQHVLTIVQNALQTDWICVLQESSSGEPFFVSVGEPAPSVKDIKALIETHINGSQNIISYLETGARQKALHHLGVEVVLASKGSSTEHLYLFLSRRKSGYKYAFEDLKNLDTVKNTLLTGLVRLEQFEQIENFNVSLQSEIKNATAELRRSNEKLKALDEAKDEFISMASHQLRTPLTSVKGYLSMLGEGDAGKLNASQKQFVNQAFVSSQRMVYLIADLLNVSRLKTGKFIIEATPVYLPEVIESEIAQLYETVKARGITMTFDKPKEFPMLNLDETKIRQVVMNFTDNAIYYTPTGGEIRLALKESPESVEFTVTDDGIGVPKADQHHLFTKFYRAGNARKARPDGTGLGLFMAQKVVVAQGGAIIFKSQEGKGSTFGFSFAKSKIAVPETKKT